MMLRWQSFGGYVFTRRRMFFYPVVLATIFALPLLIHRLPVDVGAFPENWNLHLREPIDEFQDWVIGNRASHFIFVWFFEPISDAIDVGIRQVEQFLLWLPWPAIILSAYLVGYRAGGVRIGLLAGGGLLFMGLVGLWDQSMQTLALMGVSVVISLAIGLPLGILTSRNDRLEASLRPLLDGMQTMPAFVYLIPVLLFFGIARVPAVIATVIYALPPSIRLTNLGIRRVSPTAVEAARAFGSTDWQILTKVQLPLAMPTIMAGVNQTIMMALGIVVIAALIGAGGLGREVLLSLQRLRVGEGLEAGLAIVFMAIIFDRISAGFSQKDNSPAAQKNKSFHLLPNRLARFALARAFEQAIDLMIVGIRRCSKTLARGLGAIVGEVMSLIGRKNAGRAISPFLQRHAFFVTSLILLAILLYIGITNSTAEFSEFPENWSLNLSQPVDSGVAWMRDNLYQVGNLPIGTGPLSDFLVIYGLNPLRSLLQNWLVWPLFIVAVVLVAHAVAGWRTALFSAIGLAGIGLLGMWDYSMDTSSQVIIAVLVTVSIAVPLGILSSRSDTFEAFLRPILDTLQTIPPFVYLVPVIMLFNVGRVPGIMASVLYALPPGIRLINLGIRQVAPDTVEAAQAFGSTPRQILVKVQLPLAMPAIMLGINQVIMMVLAMVIIAGLVGGGGLGLEAVVGLAKNQTGRGIEAGLAIVILAMIMDRITQTWAKKRKVVGQKD
ncbi:MAG: ABC transporter permease subunit [Anaerolineae bacterium]|nr:ABC transporter permease subunit [Anaerolineae bacterium]